MDTKIRFHLLRALIIIDRFGILRNFHNKLPTDNDAQLALRLYKHETDKPSKLGQTGLVFGL